jgi:hypothetical protein
MSIGRQQGQPENLCYSSFQQAHSFQS